MAISNPVMVSGGEVQSSGTAASLSIGPFTAPAGARIFVLAQASKLSPPPATFSVSDTEGLTWNDRSGPLTVGSGIAAGLGNYWDAESNGNATTVTITPSASCPRWTFQVGYVTADGTIVFVQAKVATGDNTSPTVTLDSAPGADSLLIAGLLTNGANAITEDGDYTLLSEVSTTAGSNCTGNIAYRNGSTGGDQTVAHSIAARQQWDFTLVEYEEDAGGGGGTILPMMMQHYHGGI